MLQINNLTKIYGDNIAIDNISFNIKEGDFYSLLGKNGAGKSTIIGILSSLIKKDNGKINIFNYDLDINFLEIKSTIGVVTQDYNFNQFETVMEIILNQAGYYGIKRHAATKKAEKILKIFDLWNFKNITSMKLSGGMKRRLMIVKALIHEPKILILDEPTAGVDIISRRLIWDFLTTINKNGTTIILTTHYLEEIEKLCNSVAILEKGKIILETSVKSLLNKVDEQIYIIETTNIQKLKFLNDNIKNISENTYEICLNKDLDLNYFLELIVKNKITITNITNKKNNLEDLFIKLTS